VGEHLLQENHRHPDSHNPEADPDRSAHQISPPVRIDGEYHIAR